MGVEFGIPRHVWGRLLPLRAAAPGLLPDKLAMQLICPILYISNDQTHSRIFIPLTSFLFSQGQEKTKKVH